MKSIKSYLFSILLFLFCWSTESVFAECCWDQKANFGGGNRLHAISFSIDGKGYVGCGLLSGTRYKDLWEYNRSTDTWTQKASLPGNKRSSATGFSIRDKGYVGTGYDGTNLLEDFWEYNPNTNNWVSIADFGGSQRRQAKSFVIDSFGYVGTGDSGTVVKDFWKYNPNTDKWTKIADFGGGKRKDPVAFAIDSFGYVGTGRDGGSNFKKDFWRYNPSTDTWMRVADFGGSSRNNAIAFTLNNKGYVGLGTDGTRQKDFWKYTAVIDTWKRICDFQPGKRTQGIGFALDINNDGINDRGYAALGLSSTGQHQDCWELTVLPPQAEFSYKEDSLYTISFSDSSQHTDSITWLFGDGTIDTDTTPTHFFSDTLDTVTTCLIATNPCASDTTCKTIPLCPPKTTAKFFYQTEGLDVHFIDSSQNATSWQWSFGDGDYNFSQEPSHGYVDEGTYEVCLMVTNQCYNDSVCDSVTVKPTGITKPYNNNITISPNPVQHDIQIQGLPTDIEKIRLINMNGQVVRAYTKQTMHKNIQLNVGEQKPGLYFLEIQTSRLTFSRKIIITNK